MSRTQYKTVPDPIKTMPRCIPFIVVNECAERFSFYGMTAILTVFMTHYLRDSSGNFATMTKPDATIWYHNFNTIVYCTPLVGSLIADIFWGKYNTIFWISLFYCLGHATLSAGQTQSFLFVGLALIAVGAGGIKPCVSANVGDQFGRTNEHLLSKVYSWFYFSINLGAFFSQFITPYLLDHFGHGEKYDQLGPKVAFAVPGILMAIAAFVFWLGRKKYVHVPPAGWSRVKENFSGENLRTLIRMAFLFLCISPFYALYYQNGSEWVLQAEQIDRHFNLNLGFGHWEGDLLASQIQSVNAVLILVFIPLFAYGVYPLIDRFFPLTALRKLAIGMFGMVITFLPIVHIQSIVDAGGKPSFWWQVLAYTLVTAAEIMVSIPVLEFGYTQAPKKIKSLIMALYFACSISFGNFLEGQIVKYLVDHGNLKRIFFDLTNPANPSPNSKFYVLFTGLMLAASVLFLLVAKFFPIREHLQDEGTNSSGKPAAA